MNQTDDDLADVTPEPLLRVYLFGPLRVTWQGIPLQGLTRPQLQALWAYLLLVHRHRPVPRERLAFTFWPGGSETQARNSLRQHLYLLRQGLPSLPDSQPGSSPEPVASVPWLLLDPEEIRVNPQAQLWVDVWAFEDGLTRGEAELEAAVQLAGADLLPDLSDDWLTVERERLRLTYNRALTRLVLFKQRQGDRPAALAWAGRLIAHDAWNEEAHCLLIALHHANGDRTAALEQFKECQRILRDEAGVAPSPAALALREAVLRGKPLPAPWSEFRGPSESIAAQILQEAAAPPQPGLFTLPFVGREAELHFLTDHWRKTTAATASSSGIVLVGGEAGIGKTRLLSELAGQVEGRGGQVLWGHCYAFERHVPYQPVVEALRAALPRLAAGDIPFVWLAEAARLLPDLRELRPGIPEPAELQGEQAQARLVEGLWRCLLSLSEEGPLLLLLEDLHWAADSTLMWLHALGRQLGNAPVFIVGSYRQEEVGAGHPLREWMREVRRQNWGTLLPLHPLAEEAVHSLVKTLSGLGEIAGVLARRLQTESEGNPFFLSELLHHLEETGQLEQHREQWAGAWVETRGAGALPLPESVREAILARVERLSEAAREFLGYAAVAGREFDLKVIQAATGWVEEQTLDALDELVERGLVREGAPATSRDHKFNHHLVQEVVYGDLPRARRQVRHRQVGEAMVAVYGEGAAGELAHHFEQAGVKQQALKYLKLAGDQAKARFANADALDYYARALALTSDGSEEARFDLLAARVEIWHRFGRREEQRADLEELEANARGITTLGDGPSPGSGQSEASLRLARVYILWATFYEVTSDYAALAQAAQTALALFQRAGDRRGEARSLEDLGWAASRQANYSTAHESFQAALTIHQELGDRRAEARGIFNLGTLGLQMGDDAAARLFLEQALVIDREIGNRDGEATSLLWLGDLNSVKNYPLARLQFEQGLALSRAIGKPLLEANFLGQLGAMSLATGEFEAAEEYFARESPIYQAIGNKLGIANVLRNRAIVAWQLGDDAVAFQLLKPALESFRTLGDRMRETWVLNLLGDFMRQKGEYQTARNYLEQALEQCRQMGRRQGVARSQYLLGELAWAEGEAAAAAGCWHEAVTLYDAIGRTYDTHSAQARLAGALVVLNKADEARPLAEAVWTAWQDESPVAEVLDEIRQSYLALARTFTRLGEPQAARACLEQAHAFVQGRLAHISDEARRQSFLTRVPVNREIEAAYAGLALEV